MLASVDFGALGGGQTTSLAEESKLCEKKDFIFDKFNQLLKKLGAEVSFYGSEHGKDSADWFSQELNLNITDEKTRAQYQVLTLRKTFFWALYARIDRVGSRPCGTEAVRAPHGS